MTKPKDTMYVLTIPKYNLTDEMLWAADKIKVGRTVIKDRSGPVDKPKKHK